MAKTKEKDKLNHDPLGSLEQNQLEYKPPHNKHYSKYHNVIDSIYFRIVFTGVLMLLLFLTAFSIAYFSELRNKGSESVEQVEEDIPEAKVIIPTLNPTANWNTYTNTDYKYSLIYPPDLNPKDYDQVVGKAYDPIAEQVSLIEFTDGAESLTIIVSVSELQTNKDLYTAYQLQYEDAESRNKFTQSSPDGEIKTVIKKITIAGYEAYQIDLISSHGIASTTVLNNDGTIFSFQLLSDNEVDKKTLDQILSTFQFLEE